MIKVYNAGNRLEVDQLLAVAITGMLFVIKLIFMM